MDLFKELPKRLFSFAVYGYFLERITETESQRMLSIVFVCYLIAQTATDIIGKMKK
jgi:hypothetical protein